MGFFELPYRNGLTVTDQMGNRILLPNPPKRIISLVPSQTEFLFDLGLENQIVGITKFCIYPTEKVKGKALIGGTKNFNLTLIDKLEPDLIIGNKEENYREGIEALQDKYPVWMSDMKNLPEVYEMMACLGKITACQTKATQIIKTIKSGFARLPPVMPISTAYFIWKNPYMVAASGTFIDEIMQKGGFQNVFTTPTRYPEIGIDEIKKSNPKLILLSSEPYPFREKHLAEFKEMCPQALIKLVDGELFSWYGSRLQFTPAYLLKLRKETDASTLT